MCIIGLFRMHLIVFQIKFSLCDDSSPITHRDESLLQHTHRLIDLPSHIRITIRIQCKKFVLNAVQTIIVKSTQDLWWSLRYILKSSYSANCTFYSIRSTKFVEMYIVHNINCLINSVYCSNEQYRFSYTIVIDDLFVCFCRRLLSKYFLYHCTTAVVQSLVTVVYTS